jgi:hypothetical protein
VRKERDDIQLTVLEMDGRRVGGRDWHWERERERERERD